MGRYKPTKMAGSIVQGVLKDRMEIVEAENCSLYPHRFSVNYSLTVKYTSAKCQKWLGSTNSQTRGPGWVIDKQIIMSDLLFILVYYY